MFAALLWTKGMVVVRCLYLEVLSSYVSLIGLRRESKSIVDIDSSTGVKGKRREDCRGILRTKVGKVRRTELSSASKEHPWNCRC